MSTPRKLVDAVFKDEFLKNIICGNPQKYPINTNKWYNRKELWYHLLDGFQRTMSFLRCRKNLEDEEIELFQRSANKFCEIFVALFGNKALTNYVHDLQGAHLKYFLKKCKGIIIIKIYYFIHF